MTKKKNINYKKGQTFGKWKLVSYINGGGNGEVWKCKNQKGEIRAIKLLKSVKQKPYSRFLDEVKVIEENSNVRGIIPMIDKSLPEKLSKGIPYYVMPLAEDAIESLRGRPLEDKIEAILEISRALKELHKKQIYHRDIKPGNILFLNSEYVLADFGLVDYPDKKDISDKNEVIGPKWTMAPEMKRDPFNADGEKADIYSLGKTLWILLSENLKCFDGQYSSSSILGIQKHFSKSYVTPIDRLLSISTEHDPKRRPDIDDFISILEDWKILNESFHESNLEQWFEIQKKLFPTAFPQRVIWENKDDIIDILNVICSYDSLNHLFFPTGGGLDLEKARSSFEKDCIELDFQLIDIVKPKRLIFESFRESPEWNYFRLETNLLNSSAKDNFEEDLEIIGEEVIDETQEYREDVTEIYPGKYGKYGLLENREYYNKEGYDIPDTARHVRRWFKGSFVIFCKRSPYNMEISTYDGRHDKMTTDEFRDYIQQSIDYFKEEEEKESFYGKFIEKHENKERKLKYKY